MPETNSIFEMEQVTVSYGFRRAVSELNLKLSAGQSLGLLGQNGAGKTSSIRALVGMVRPKRGKISVLGVSPGSLKGLRKLGFAPEEGTPPDFLSGEEYLNWVAKCRLDASVVKVKVAEEIACFEVPERKKIRDYSKGMRRRLVLAQAFLGDPKLIILDEPVNGLDPLFITRLRQRIEAYLRNGGSMLLSSHILSEVEKTCSRVAIMKDGSLVKESEVSALVKEFGSIEEAFSKTIGGTT